ncbi:MAG: DNA polymerase III subunit beta, partial [Acidimicrobiia bacterium]|nr:DNA polymerase III subunit beta [Acidimicrobiia bacterium]
MAAEQVRVAIGEREVVFASDRGSLSIRLIEGTFPNYRQLLPDDYPAAVELDKDG